MAIDTRQRWAEVIGLDRIRAINQLRSEVMPVAQRFIDALVVLKARQVEALQRNEDPADVRLGMEALGGNYLAELDTLLKGRMPLLGQAQMPKGATLEMARHWVTEVIDEIWGTGGSDLELPDHLLAALPDSVRAFYARRSVNNETPSAALPTREIPRP